MGWELRVCGHRLVHRNVVICSDQANVGEDSGSMKSSSKIKYERNWKSVKSRDIV